MTDTASAAAVSPSPARVGRSALRSIAVPTEHGGWGLTAGLCLGSAAIIAFLARTPLRIVLVDRHRNRDLDRTGLARRVLLVEVAVIVALVAGAAVTATATFWWPAAIAAPLVATELWFDTRWSSRELIVADFAALAVAIAAVAIDPTVAPGAVAVAGVVTIQRITARTPVPAKVIGIRQTILGLAVVAATVAGIHLS